MRLFTAIQFDEATKSRISEIQASLRGLGQKGNFTNKDNLHLTLIFIGETPISQINSVKYAIDKVDMQPFSIKLSGLGRFKRDGGDLWWLGVNENKHLSELYKNLAVALSGIGISVDNRPYKPHLTLVREFIAAEGKHIMSSIGKIPELSVDVNKISLMKSERVGGKLIYTEIHAKEF